MKKFLNIDDLRQLIKNIKSEFSKYSKKEDVPTKISQLEDDTTDVNPITHTKYAEHALYADDAKNVHTATFAEYATRDYISNVIHETYAVKDSVPTKISQLEDDTLPVGPNIAYAEHANFAEEVGVALTADRATHDQNGNVIHETYATKSELGNAESELEKVESIAKGRATGYVFNTVEDMNLWLASDQDEAPYPNTDLLVLGDNLYIRATDVPDYWWDGSAAQPLETQKVDLTEYVKNTDYATGDKAGIAKIARNSVYGVYADEKNLLRTYPASPTDIRNKTNNTRPITVNNLEYAVEVCTNQDINAELTEAQLKLPPSTQTVKAVIGDIDTALDSIIAIQNQLMGVSE